MNKVMSDEVKRNMSIAHKKRQQQLKRKHTLLEIFYEKTESGQKRKKVKYICDSCKTIKKCRFEKFNEIKTCYFCERKNKSINI